MAAVSETELVMRCECGKQLDQLIGWLGPGLRRDDGGPRHLPTGNSLTQRRAHSAMAGEQVVPKAQQGEGKRAGYDIEQHKGSCVNTQ